METPLIVIDGLDGCGKTTQLRLLVERAESDGKTCVFTREPGGAPLSEALRELFKSDMGAKASALTQFLMMWASRRNYLEQVVLPALEDNISVFSDRGDSSTLAYQIYGKNAPELESEFWRLRKLVLGEHFPILYIFLDVSPEEARSRATSSDSTRGEASHFDVAPLEFYERVYKGFREFGNHSSVKMVSVDGTQSRYAISEEVYRIVSDACGW
ncbi:MAG: dTMP kinase [Candidatus Yonathbacteria bacterium]|nr:dTMP kinase [Candidatus Yonathbacteria bacterium]